MIRIREAEAADAGAISALIRSVAHHFTLDPEGRGAEAFLATIAPAAVAGYVTDERYRYLVALDGARIVGAGALRDGAHLYHLFVDEARHGRGVARALWARLAEGIEAERVTVNSTLSAVPVYERFGFEACGARVEADGVAFVPMELARSRP